MVGSEGGRSTMRIPRAVRNGAAVVAVAYLAPFGAPPARAQVKLEYKFPEGQTLTYRTTSNPFQTVSLMGMGIQSGEKKTVVWTQRIGRRRSDSHLPVAVKVESLRVDLRLQGGIDLSYDSSKPDARIADPDLAPFGELYKLESRVAYTVVLDDRNRVKAVEGTEALRRKAS